jgi:hypothetical protein
MQVIASWTGSQADALRQSLRKSNESFAAYLDVAVRTVANWRKNPDMIPSPASQRLLDAGLARASDEEKAHFAALAGKPANGTRAERTETLEIPGAGFRKLSPDGGSESGDSERMSSAGSGIAEISGLDHGLGGVPVAENELAGFSGRSHKFIAAHAGSDVVDQIISAALAKPVSQQWLECHSVEVGHSAGKCTLYLWPFGTAVFHLVEDLDMPSISALAVWRIRSYEENLAWATARLRQLARIESVSASYVLSLYWIDSPRCTSAQVDTALRVICSPRVLLRRETANTTDQRGYAERVERTLLAGGFVHDGIKSFGLTGVSVGYASWSGVVYHPCAPEQSLTEDEIVNCELSVQAVWAYCEHVNREVEKGRDPDFSDKFGWRHLRGVKSRLVNPRPQETGQHREMRNSIIETSGLMGHLDQAIDVLRQLQER